MRCRLPLIGLLVGALLPSAARPATATLQLQNARLRLVLHEQNGFAPTGLQHRGRGVDFVKGSTGPLWQLVFRDAAGTEVRVDAATPALRGVGASTHGLTLEWIDLPVGRGKARVWVRIWLPEGSSLSWWRLGVQWSDPGLKLWQVNFPCISGIAPVGAEDVLTMPVHWGRMVRDPVHALRRYTHAYPGSGAMQFWSYYGRGAGLYLGAQDPALWYKRFSWDADPSAERARMTLEHFPPLAPGSPCRWELPYPVVLGVFDGDWYDAAQLYRAWAVRQRWCAAGPVGTRRDIPAWFKSVALWLKYYGEPGKVVAEAYDHLDALRVPMALHYYRYPISQFDDNYPEFAPARPGFLQGIRDLQALGVPVMPYTQGSIWDIDTESWRREGGHAAAARTEMGALYEWPIDQNTFAWMCPAAEGWQAKVRDFTRKLVWEYGVDGVYLDVLAAGSARECYAPNHGHAPHGGTYWGEGNRELMRRLRHSIRARRPTAIFTTEEIGEGYLDLFDGFLTLDVTRGGYVPPLEMCPLFTAVYHDYAIQYGSDCALGSNPDLFCALMATHLAWGAKPTLSEMVPPRIRDHPIQAAYLRAVTHCVYRAGRKFLLEGKWLRPPPLDVPTQPVRVGRQPHTVLWPVVRHSLWRAPDGTLGLLLTNWSAPECWAELSLNLDAYHLPKGEWRVRRLWPPEDGLGQVLEGRV
ncbi:MAG: DUF6259 domain-containing protein, partial [Armatimonadota bacterium]|nr:DUF6259 domain-containing protein [Armatimonadota bacterium]